MANTASGGTEEKRFERHVARKLWIREILDGAVVTEGQGATTTLENARVAAQRVNVIGVVIANEELPVSSITIDDGTGQISVRSFERTIPYTIGTVVQVIARPRSYQSNMYLAAEAVVAVNAAWAEYRKVELGAVLHRAKPKQVTHTIEPNTDSENRVEKIIAAIKRLDPGDGAPIEQVAVAVKYPDAEALIEQLLLAGDIFELRPGRVKVL